MILIYSDMDGSSANIRNILKSDSLVEYVKKLPTVDFQFFMKRNIHPYITAQYVNGYKKTICLRKCSQYQIMQHFDRFSNESILYDSLR